MKEATATLIGTQTKDGFWRIKLPQTPVGKQYRVDLDSVHTVKFFNIPSQQFFDCEVINAYQDSSDTWERFPIELLEIGR